MLKRTLEILFTLTFCEKSPSGLCQAFIDLGPAFIKLGQLLASRPDFVPKEYAEKFRELLDHDNQVDYIHIDAVIRRNLGEEKYRSLEQVDMIPLSSASIGQVHRATLKNGEKVIIKVRKPNVVEIINQDTEILNRTALILCLIPFFRGINFDKIVAEFSVWVKKELDFRAEAQRAKTLAKNLESYKNFVIPKVYDEFVTEELLVLEYIDGITVNEILNMMASQNITNPDELELPFKIDYHDLSSEMIDCYIFKQILTDGYFHADPHPANIIILPDNKIGLVDFGIMATLDKREHTQILMCILGVMENDPEKLLQVLTTLAAKDLTKEEQMEIVDALSEELHQMHGGTWKEATLGELMLSILSLGKNFNLHWSPGVVLGMKAIVMIEGIALRVVSSESIIELIKPHLRKFLISEARSKLSEEEVYKNIFKMIEFSDKLGDIGELFGKKGLKVELAKEVKENG